LFSTRISVAEWPRSIGTQRRSQERHIIFLKERAEYFGVWWANPCRRSELFIKLVTAPRRIDDNDLTRLIREVEESVRDFGRKISEAAFLTVKYFVSDLDFVLAFQNMDRFLLLVVDMQWGTASRRDLDDKIIEGSTGIFARDLEDEILARAGVEPQTLAWA
jgi:hypothetical protein